MQESDRIAHRPVAPGRGIGARQLVGQRQPGAREIDVKGLVEGFLKIEREQKLREGRDEAVIAAQPVDVGGVESDHGRHG